MPFSRLPTALPNKAILWFASLLFVLTVPPTGRVRPATGGQSPIGVQEIVWVNWTLATSHYAMKLGTSRFPGTRATSAKGAAIAKGRVPSGSHQLDPLGLDQTVTLPSENVRLIAEIQSFVPYLSITRGYAELARARGPPVNSTRQI